MSTKIRVVDVVVPNGTALPVIAHLRLEAVDPMAIDGLLAGRRDLSGRFSRRLEVLSCGLTTDCGESEAITGARSLALPLGPFEDKVIRVHVETYEPLEGEGGLAAFQLSDSRNGNIVGGVAVICSTPEYPSELPPERESENACPLELSAPELTFAYSGANLPDPVKPEVAEPNMRLALVAVFSNRSDMMLSEASVYLEHLSRSNVSAEPKVWNVGTMAPGQEVWLSWDVDHRHALPGNHEATFVVRSKGHAPVRRRAVFSVRTEEEG